MSIHEVDGFQNRLMKAIHEKDFSVVIIHPDTYWCICQANTIYRQTHPSDSFPYKTITGLLRVIRSNDVEQDQFEIY